MNARHWFWLVVAGAMLFFTLFLWPAAGQGGYACARGEGLLRAAEDAGLPVRTIEGAAGNYLARFAAAVLNPRFTGSVGGTFTDTERGFVELYLQQGAFLCGPMILTPDQWRKMRLTVYGNPA